MISDRYNIVAGVGSGRFSEVYLALDRELPKKVAIKMPRISHAEGPGFDIRPSTAEQNARLVDIERLSSVKVSHVEKINSILLREGKVLKEIRHPAFVKVLDEGIVFGLYCLVLEYIEGRPLNEGALPLLL